MHRPWPGNIAWYRMWGLGVLAVPVLLRFMDWFPAIFLSGCAMGAYGVLLPFVYDGAWTRDTEGDSVWLPTESRSSDPPGPPHVTEERGSILRLIGHSLFPLFVITVLVYMIIDKFMGN